MRFNQPCNVPGCPNLVPSGKGRCKDHPYERVKRTVSLSSARWKLLRREALERDGGRCTWLDEDGERCIEPARQVDHIVPTADGGEDEIGNLQSLCLRHHGMKTMLEVRDRPASTPRPKPEPARESKSVRRTRMTRQLIAEGRTNEEIASMVGYEQPSSVQRVREMIEQDR